MARAGEIVYGSRAMTRHLASWLLAFGLGTLALGCKPAIGDNCSNSIDCSPRGERICDLAQPGGYCTIRNCESGTCPDDALCVEWRGVLERTADAWCMKSCGKDSDCRGDYRCVLAGELFDDDGNPLASVLDEGRAAHRFCAATNP